MKDDNGALMSVAIKTAMSGIEANEGGPFGACIVKNGKVIAFAHNTVLKDKDPTCHAEMNAIRLASKALGTHVLAECDIYTTAEPCPMCLAAIYWARIKKIYIAASKEVAAHYGFDDAFFYEEMKKATEHRHIPCEEGISAKESEAVFEKWKALGRELY